MTVDYYFIISDYVLDRFNGQKFWHASVVSDTDDPIVFNKIPIRLAHQYLLYSDKAIACKSEQPPVYIKNRESSYKEKVTEDMVYIVLASQTIN